MRKIEFNELKLKDIKDEESFYQVYLKRLREKVEEDKSFHKPEKQYEIFYLNALDGKIMLLNKKYIQSENKTEKEEFYNYEIAYQIYNLILDIYDGMKDEQNEQNELYKEERMKKANEIVQLEKQDERIFEKALEKYNIIMNSEVYQKYIELQRENIKLKEENKKLIEKLNSNQEIEKGNIGFFKKIINKLKNKRLSM